MVHNCDYYREKALLDGMDSHAAAQWRLHSKNCNGCRSEIHMLETLCQHATEKRQHISQKDYSRLLETVRQLYQPNQQTQWGRFFWNFTWKTTALAALLVLVFKIAAPLSLGTKRQTVQLSDSPAKTASTEVFQKKFTITADQGKLITAPSAPVTTALGQAELAALFQSLSGNEIEQNLQKLRRSVGEQIDSFSALLDHELNGDF